MVRVRCHHCGQQIPEARLRYGVLLSPLKIRIFDAIERAGKPGIAGSDLFERTLKGRDAQRAVLKCHVYQINERLVSTDCRIHVTRHGRDSIYRIRWERSEPLPRVAIDDSAERDVQKVTAPRS